MAELSRPPIPAPTGTQNLAALLRAGFLAIDSLATARVVERFSDLRPAFAPVITNIDDGGTRVTELARRTGLTKPSVVYLVDEMEGLGYLERIPDPEDGRAKLVKPTARALAAVELGRREIAAIEAEWTSALGEEAIAGMRATLEELRGRLWSPHP